MLPQRRRLPADALGQRPDDLGQGGTDEVVDVGGGRLAVEHRHDQPQRLGLGEDDRRQPRPAPEPVSAVGASGRLDGDARLAEDPDVAARGPLRDAQPLGELVGRRARAGLEDLEGAQGPGGGAQIGRHTGRLGDRPMNRKQIVRNWP